MASLNPISNTSYVVAGVDENKKPRELLVDEDGKLVVSGGGGGGDATAANQALQLAKTPEFGVAGTPSGDVITVQGIEDGTPQAVVGKSNVVRATFNRPSDTTQYAINDAVSNSTSAPTIITLADVARVNGGTGIITDLRLSTNNNSTTAASFKVILFNDTITPVNDNSPFPQLWANDAKRIGSFDLTLQTGGTGSDAASATLEQLGKIFKCAGGSRNLYAAIVANATYTPVSGQTFAITIGVALD